MTRGTVLWMWLNSVLVVRVVRFLDSSNSCSGKSTPLSIKEHITLQKTNMVNSKAQAAVQKSLDSVTGDKSNGVAGLVFVAVDKNGDEIAAHASGKTGLESKEDMSLDNIFWIASCTKILATIACLQAVEQGKLSLDDHKQVYKLCPELEKVKVLQEDGSLVGKKNDITLRMLLSHTAGFGYEL
jgi:CubicO group peptidase (beta-lactamase class C family)